MSVPRLYCICAARTALGLFEGTRHQCEMPGRLATLSLCVGEHWMPLTCPWAQVERGGLSGRRSDLALVES